jgi:ATP-binding cassette subfamily B protein
MKQKFKALKNLLFLAKPYLKYDKTYTVVSFIISVFVAPINSLASVLFTQSVIDAVASGATFKDIVWIILKFLFVLLITLLVQNIYDIIYSEKKQAEIHLKINSEIYEQVLKTDYKYFDDPNFYNNYTWTINEYANKSREAINLIINTFKSLSTIISMITVILVLGPWLIVITLIEMIITVYFETRRNKIIIHKHEKILPFDRKISYIHRIFYQREYAADVKATNLREKLFNLYHSSGDKKISIIKIYAKKILFWLCAQNFLAIIYNASIMTYISYGLIVSKKIVGIGKFMSLITANSQLMNSLYGFFSLVSKANSLDLYADKIRTFFEAESQIENTTISKKHNPKAPFNIEIKNLSFKYPNSEFGLSNINLKINAGEKIAIVGENGSGKTTLTKLLLRFYDPDQGNILINGIPINNYNLLDIRNKIGTAFQTSNVYAFPLSQNLRLYRNSDDTHLVSTINSLELTEKLKKTHSTLDTELTREFNQDGLMLSNGEIQKIGIGRIMNHDFGLLILDEPSSSLDPISEYNLTNILYDQANKTTTILIAHRLSMVRDADYIYVMKEGTICESGTHTNLMNHKSLYYDMFVKQSENYVENT